MYMYLVAFGNTIWKLEDRDFYNQAWQCPFKDLKIFTDAAFQLFASKTAELLAFHQIEVESAYPKEG